jgi:hypothetical protein
VLIIPPLDTLIGGRTLSGAPEVRRLVLVPPLLATLIGGRALAGTPEVRRLPFGPGRLRRRFFQLAPTLRVDVSLLEALAPPPPRRLLCTGGLLPLLRFFPLPAPGAIVASNAVVFNQYHVWYGACTVVIAGH